MSLVQVDRHGTTAIVSLQDPRRRNILSPALCGELCDAVVALGRDERIKAIVVTGASPAFCGGADLSDLEAAADGDTARLDAVYRSFMTIADCPLPTIAAVNGPAIGAGFNLALACDVRIASTAARFETRFLGIGVHPGGGHGWMLLRAVGWAEAAQMLLLDMPVDAAHAHRCGLVQAVVEPELLLDVALASAGRTAALPRELILRSKASLRLAARSDHPATFAHETGEQLYSLTQPPFRSMVARLKAHIAARPHESGVDRQLKARSDPGTGRSVRPDRA